MIDGQRRHLAITDLDWLLAYHLTESGSVKLLLGCEHGSGKHHLAGATGGIDRNRWPREVQQTGMIEMSVTEQNAIWFRMVGVEETRNGRDHLFGFQSFDRLNQGGTGIKRLTVGVYQGQTKIENQPCGCCGKFHAGATDLFRAAMNGQFHEG
ncbi:hypothetical protein FRUB_10102 [Fimbriiglobus ruber]|uniref:Uncharacterized protein n=1 Tax=Fimbriiglobus ruber TaxID=1908690 RepID=A0A225CXT1_9BACT|nr:hypothetical protein FRUB_10102 [Fimbriiglobus ruber]